MVALLGGPDVTPAKPMKDHPGPDLVASYLDGALDADTVDRLEGHLADCPACRRALVDLRATLALPEEPVPARLLARAIEGRTPLRRVVWRPAAVAAVLVAIVAIGALVGLWRRRAAGDVRESDLYRQEERPTLTLLSPRAGEAAPAAGVRFTWSPDDGADRYLVIVTDGEGYTLATLEVRPPAASVVWVPPPSTPPGAALLWRVRAISGGRTLGETHPGAFVLR